MSGGLQRWAWAPWVGLVLPPIAWAAHHQVGSDLVFYDCRIGATGAITALGLAMILVSTASGVVSWLARQPGGSPMELRNFAACLGAMCAGLFSLALIFQTMATLTLPACHQ
jgi:hypothetical protein